MHEDVDIKTRFIPNLKNHGVCINLYCIGKPAIKRIQQSAKILVLTYISVTVKSWFTTKTNGYNYRFFRVSRNFLGLANFESLIICI